MSATPTPPDGFDHDWSTETARAWCRRKLRDAIELSYLHDHSAALEKVQEAQHGFRMIVLRQRMDEAGVLVYAAPDCKLSVGKVGE